MILLDDNILVRFANTNDPHHLPTRSAILTYSQEQPLVIASQSLFEFWAVATRAKDVNGLGMSITTTRQWIDRCLQQFVLIADPDNLVHVWVALVDKFAVSGFRAHDARYVALMQLHGISQFMTYNVKHFSGYPISIITPGSSKTSN